MELRVFWRTLRRRWYLSLVVLAYTVGATAFVATSVGPTYQAEGSALVFPPARSAQVEGKTSTVGNPYLELAGVNQARDVVIRTLKSRTVQEEWGEKFPGMTYEATPDFTNSAPIILFDVEGGTPEGATMALDDLMARVPQILDNLQGGLGLPQEELVTARKLTQDARPAVVRKGQIRASLLAAAGTAGLGLLLLALADSLLTMRTRRRRQRWAAREAAAAALAEEEAQAAVAAEAEEPAATIDEPPGTEDDAEEAEKQPIYTYRVPVESEMAVSPARSRWRPQSATPQVAREDHRFRTTASAKARARAAGRNR